MIFLKGLLIGFLIAAPVGPVGILCIRRALADGRLAAFVAGLGAAVADTFYGAVAGLGLTLVSDFLLDHKALLSVVGGLFLLGLGWRTLRAHPDYSQTSDVHLGLLRDFFSTFAITLTNPATILAFVAVFAALGGVRFEGINLASWALIAGVFTGSALWWLLLSALAGAARDRFNENWLNRLNHASGILLMLCGVAVLGTLAV
ncbi:LysE family translocator [Roseospirillum parvum]|uniref:Threonine/homoserine/homoserine lactone efflux protein n=1 Tax=Roseospirillum parvum TaxID=83401 RepID=A0A1G7ZSF5_9PROT|nr:LysE family transporter [Roseospirillum parvum]SDH11557.1 Threonine/homoserine/homoserine lactone efflux protein [Roseospirillum parvum]